MVEHLTENQGVASSNLALGTSSVVQVRLLGDKDAFGSCATDLRLIRYSYFGTYATLPGQWEMSATEQRYEAILAVIAEGRTSVRRDAWRRDD